MSNNERIYIVRDPKGSASLVKARSRAQALRAVVAEGYSVEPASALIVAELVAKGQPVIATKTADEPA